MKDIKTESLPEPNHQKANSFRMFDRIYKRYDFLNRLFSFGQDIFWRKRVAGHFNDQSNQTLLDLAAGTGDVAFTILKHKKQVSKAICCDMSRKMLEMAQMKAFKGKKHLITDKTHHVSFIQGDAGVLPFKDTTFDATTMAFGIRNVVDVPLVLTEIRRVLKENGQLLILEFSLPLNPVVRRLHLFYLRRIIPFIGSIVSKDKHAYRYLNETIESFPFGTSFCHMMEDAGFKDVTFTPLTFGVATLYRGVK